MRILLDSCDKKRLIDSLVEIVQEENQLAWVMGMLPNMNEQFVANHYSNLLSIAAEKCKKNIIERIVGKVSKSYYPWDFPTVQFVVKKKGFVNDTTKEKCDVVTAEIDEYLAKNSKLLFEEFEKLINKYPYFNSREEKYEGYPNEMTFYSISTVYLCEDDISKLVAEE